MTRRPRARAGAVRQHGRALLCVSEQLRVDLEFVPEAVEAVLEAVKKGPWVRTVAGRPRARAGAVRQDGRALLCAPVQLRVDLESV